MRTIGKLSDLSGRRVLLTGGAGYIGLAAGEALVEMGALVSVLDIDAAACDERVATLSKIQDNGAIAMACDLTDEADTRRAVRETVERLGGLDIIVHCAGYVGTTQMAGWAVPFEEQSVTAWNAAMQVNLTSAFTMVQEAKPDLVASGRGSVIFFISTYGLVGPVPQLYEGTDIVQPAGYAASKGGLLQFSRYLATTLAPSIRVNTITPGGVWRDQAEVFHQRYVERTPLGRMANEEDLKGAVAYLSSDLSAYVTGHNLVVDGGWTAW
jgi:NAD(P)-dependent dehydrogenase (short-subunit alcohol dehydrogenase family)